MGEDVPLRDFFNCRIENEVRRWDDLRLADKEAISTALTAAEKAVNAALAASEKAILKAEAAAKERFDASNEIRGAMMDAQKGFASLAQFEALKERVDKAEAALLKGGSKAEGIGIASTRLLALLGAAGTVFGIIAVFLVFNQ